MFEEGIVPYNGDFEGKVQGRNRGEVEHTTTSRYHGLRDLSDKVGGNMDRSIGGEREPIGGFNVLKRGEGVG